jgi:mono/diheme cytochrome c family protein
MEEIYHYQPLSMTFCLNCHRDPAAHLRPADKITDLNWTPPGNTAEEKERWQRIHGKQLMDDWKVESLQTCSSCHR